MGSSSGACAHDPVHLREQSLPLRPGRRIQRLLPDVRSDPTISFERVEYQLDFVSRPLVRGFRESRFGLVIQAGRISGGQLGTPGRLEPDHRRAGFGKLSLPGRASKRVLAPSLRPCERIIVAEVCTGEECLKLVIVGLRNWVELVVMAAGAADRQPQEHKPRRLGDVVERILAAQALIVQINHVGVASIEPRGDEGPRIVRTNFVAGKLQADENVVRQIAVQGLDDPVSISPGVGPGLVELEAVGLGKARQVKPVLRPALAKLGARKQTVDQAVIRLGRSVGEKRLLLRKARRQSGQVEAEPSQQGRPVGSWSVLLPILLQASQDKSINRIACPRRFPHRGHRRPRGRYERPVLSVAGARGRPFQKQKCAAAWE